MVVDIIAGILFGMLAGMGVGGGGLLVIYLTAFDGIEQRTAQGVNLLFFILASSASMLYHLKKRNINFPFVIICSITGCLFAVFGSLAAAAVDSELLRRIFGGMLILAGGITLLKRKKAG